MNTNNAHNEKQNNQSNQSNHKALLITAHGSRLASANEEIRSVCNKIQQHPRFSEHYSAVYVGFLDCEKPSIPSALNQIQLDGFQHIDVFHYFLTNGQHVNQDVPAMMTAFQHANPHIQLHDLGYLGEWVMEQITSGVLPFAQTG
ncbi:sirohydrochlorin chelatase [Ostreibacterium oceani]|uniref:Sirohydrochlorin cobaltochelatase n=1 Tax=Ostreibacterium oceani TaxID=2654998 RepID=A0A6N7EXV3_9GAMM|nr:CbiX/SirB N-terminal domain-containing protein [Ostreibacterium oceani]MPV86370.1 hypothetical protein [Ostreibacterium oceani]